MTDPATPATPATPETPALADVDMSRLRTFPRRWHFLLAAIVVTVLGVYGGMLPLRFRDVSWDSAVSQFRWMLKLNYWRDWSPSYIADLAGHVILFTPMAFLWLATFCADRRRRAVLLAFPLVLVILVPPALGIEFIQVWVETRGPSKHDLIADAGGAVIGLGLWLALGQRLTHWLRALFRDRGALTLARRLLWVYLIGFVFLSIMPMDFQLSLKGMAHDYDQGKLVLVPFSHEFRSFMAFLWDTASDTILLVPVGALLRIGIRAGRGGQGVPGAPGVPGAGDRDRIDRAHEGGRGMSVVGAVFATVGIAAVTEAAQLVIRSRYTDVTQLITGGLGGLIGVLLADGLRRIAAAERVGPDDGPAFSTRGLFTAAIGLAVYYAILAGAMWHPYKPVASLDRLWVRVRAITDWPFQQYGAVSHWITLERTVRWLLLFVPVGVLLRWGLSGAARRHPWRWYAVALCVTLGISLSLELGQAALSRGYPRMDCTDVALNVLGATLGWLVTHRMLRPRLPASAIATRV